MESKTSIRIRVARFLTDRLAYWAQPNYLSEVVAFGLILMVTVWPIFLLANAMGFSDRELSIRR
jgi:hypothetical protein